MPELLPVEQYGYGAAVDYTACCAAEYHVAYPGVAVRAHDDEIRSAFAGAIDYTVGGIALLRVGFWNRPRGTA